MEKDYQVIDFHTHLGDVCKGCYERDIKSDRLGFVSSNLLERVAYNKVLTKVIALPFFPKSPLVSSAIASASFASAQNLISELDRNKVLRAVISPIEPFVSTDFVMTECEKYRGRLIGLMSVNFDRFSTVEIERQISSMRHSKKISGIKFHPNLQGIHPQSEKAQALFHGAENENAFVLIHGGITPIVYGRERHLSSSSNLVPVFKAYPKLKFVVAHAGGYFSSSGPFLSDIQHLSNVFVDTSGIGVGVILNALQMLGPDRVLFGSDWPYGTMKYSLKFAREAVRKYCGNDENRIHDSLGKILSGNAKKLLS